MLHDDRDKDGNRQVMNALLGAEAEEKENPGLENY